MTESQIYKQQENLDHLYVNAGFYEIQKQTAGCEEAFFKSTFCTVLPPVILCNPVPIQHVNVCAIPGPIFQEQNML